MSSDSSSGGLQRNMMNTSVMTDGVFDDNNIYNYEEYQYKDNSQPNMKIDGGGILNNSAPYDYGDYDYKGTDDEVSAEAQLLWIPLLYSALVIFGLLGNALLLSVLAQKRRSWSVSDSYILQLGLVDVLLLGTLPFWGAQVNKHCEHCPETLFKICRAIFNINFYIGMFLLVCICLDRTLTTVRSGRFSHHRAPFAYISCTLVWFLSIFFTGFDWHLLPPTKGALQGKAIYHVIPETGTDRLLFLRLAHLTVGFFIPFAILIAYCSHILLLRKSKGPQKKGLFILILVVVFLLCWVPYNITLILDILCYKSKEFLNSFSVKPEESLKKALTVTSAVACINASLRPLLYILTCGNFQKRIMSLFCCATAENKGSLWELGVGEDAPQDQDHPQEELQQMTCLHQQDVKV